MLYAYLNSNLGDDLFIKIISERYPNIIFRLVVSNIYKETFKENKNIRIYDLSLFNKLDSLLLRLINKKPISNMIAKNCIASVYIGGSLFIQKGNFDWHIIFRINKSRLIHLQPFYLLGANFGPYQDEEFYIKYKELFKEYKDICFRESYSYNLFKDLDNVRISPDIVFNYKPHKKVKPKKQIAVSVIDLKNRTNLNSFHLTYIIRLAQICESFISKGYEIQLISFCSNKEGDINAIEDIISGVEEKYKDKVHQCLYQGKNIESIILILQESEYILATRFHAMILGWALERPVFPIIYSNKMLNVIKDTGFKGQYTRIEEMNNLSMDDVMYNLKNNVLLDNINELRIQAEEHFKILDKLLKA